MARETRSADLLREMDAEREEREERSNLSEKAESRDLARCRKQVTSETAM